MSVTQNGHKAPAVAFRIWGVNSGLMWGGLPGSEGWRRWET